MKIKYGAVLLSALAVLLFSGCSGGIWNSEVTFSCESEEKTVVMTVSEIKDTVGEEKYLGIAKHDISLDEKEDDETDEDTAKKDDEEDIIKTDAIEGVELTYLISDVINIKTEDAEVIEIHTNDGTKKAYTMKSIETRKENAKPVVIVWSVNGKAALAGGEDPLCVYDGQEGEWIYGITKINIK